MRIIVTGAGGFIGRRTAAILVDQGHDVYAPFLDNEPEGCHRIKCDLTNNWDVSQLIRWAESDAIVHLAGNPAVRDWTSNITIANVLTTHNLLEYSPKGVRFVLASSASVYGASKRRCVEWDELLPCSPYGTSKLAAECLVNNFTAAKKVRGVSLRPVAVIGGGATHGLIPDLVRKLRSDEPELHLLGKSPGSRKPFVHVDDAARAFAMMAVSLNDDYPAMNLSNEDVVSVLEVAELASAILGIHKPIRWTPNFEGDVTTLEVANGVAWRQGWYTTLRSRGAVEAAIREIAECTK